MRECYVDKRYEYGCLWVQRDIHRINHLKCMFQYGKFARKPLKIGISLSVNISIIFTVVVIVGVIISLVCHFRVVHPKKQ